MSLDISATSPRVQYTVGSSSTTTFAYGFPIFQEADLKVYVDSTLKTLTTHYSVTGEGTTSGGNVVFGSGLTNCTVTILRDVEIARTTDFPTSGSFQVDSLNTELDTITAVQQELEDDIGRSLRLADEDSTSTLTLPLKDARKGRYLAFNTTTGNAEAGPTQTDATAIASVTSDIALLADIQDGTTATNAITTLAGIHGNVTTVAGVASNVTTIATGTTGGNSNLTNLNTIATGTTGGNANLTQINSVAGKVTEIGRLGTADAVADMALLGLNDVIADMALLGEPAVIADMAQLANADIIADMAQLANSTIIDDLALLANSTITDDMALLAVDTVIADMAQLADSTIITNMANLNASGVITNMANLNASGVLTNIGNLNASGVISNIANLNASGVITNIANLNATDVITNIGTVASNVSGVNSFADRYRVASSAPTSSLDVGDLYFDTSANELKVYKSSGWSAAGSTVNGTSARFHYDISGTPSSVSGSDSAGNTLAYDAGFVDVYVNGVRMAPEDITITSGTSVVFASALADGDDVDIVAFGTFSVANIVSTGALNSGSITSGFGNIDNGSSTITTTGAITGGSLAVNGDATITDTDASSGSGPILYLYRNSSSPADADYAGEIIAKGRNDNSEDVEYSKISTQIQDVTDGTEDGKLSFYVRSNGSQGARLHLKGNGRTLFQNKDIELSTGVNLFFEGATSNDFETQLTVTDPTQDNTIHLPDASGTVALQNASIDMNGTELILDADADTSITADTDDQIDFKTGGSDRMSIDSSGRVGIGLTPSDYTEHSDDLVVGGSSGNKGITIVGASNGYSILSLNRSTNTSTTPNGALEYYHGDNQLFIKAGGLNSIQINSDGTVQKPYQSAFSVQANQQNNLPINATTTVQFANEIFDQNADFDHTNYTFQAPVTGKYMLNVNLRMDNVQYAHTYMYMTLYTSNRVYEAIIDLDRANSNNNDWDYVFLPINVLADMDASDTAYVTMTIPNAGSASSDIVGSQKTTFSGYLAC
jgi:hypothetical protein